MHSNGSITTSICDIYDAAVADQEWPRALNSAVKFIGATSSALLVRDLDTSTPYQVNALCHHFTKQPAEVIHHYVEHYSHYELAASEHIKNNPCQLLFDDSDIWPDIQSPQSRPDYKYLSEHLGVFRRLVSRLNDNNRWFDCITFQFDQKYNQIPDLSYKQTNQLIPHLAKSIELGRMNHRLKTLYNAVLCALDHVRIGMCVLLSTGEVIVTNKEALRILDMKDGIALHANKHLKCSDDQLTDEILHAAKVVAETANGVNSVATHSLRIPRRSAHTAFLVEVTPLRDYSAEIETGLAGALFTIIDTEKKYDQDITLFAKAYNLTESEKQVCALLIAGYDNQRIADERQVKTSTIKTQVKHLRQKTGAASRVELLRLVLQTELPIG